MGTDRGKGILESACVVAAPGTVGRGNRMNYSISKNAAIDALNLADDRGQIHSILDTIDIINTLPPTCHLLEDGTLIVKVPNLSAVHRVIVDAEDSQYCKTFYQDGEE